MISINSEALSGAEELGEISQALEKIVIQGFGTVLLCIYNQTDNYLKMMSFSENDLHFRFEKVHIMIKPDIFLPFLADVYTSSTFSLMEGHFKVAFAFTRGETDEMTDLRFIYLHNYNHANSVAKNAAKVLSQHLDDEISGNTGRNVRLMAF